MDGGAVGGSGEKSKKYTQWSPEENGERMEK